MYTIHLGKVFNTILNLNVSAILGRIPLLFFPFSGDLGGLLAMFFIIRPTFQVHTQPPTHSTRNKNSWRILNKPV